MIQKPERCSFVSRNGPSVTIAAPFRLSITVAVLGDASPPAKTQWPSATSPSLNVSMAAISSGVAEFVRSSITETRYCIVRSSPLLGPRGGHSPLLRRPMVRSDTANPRSFKDSSR
jgi:hypothetical protein